MRFFGHPARRRIAGRLFVAALWLAANGTVLHAQESSTPRFTFSTGGWVVSSPAVSPDGKTIYVGVHIANSAGQGRVLAITRDGPKKWQSVLLPDWVDSSPAIGPDGTVYVGCWDGKLYAFDGNPASEPEAGVAPRWSFDTGSFVYSSPAIGPDGTVYFGAGDSALHALKPDGTERWPKFATGNWIFSSPAVGPDGTVYFGSDDNNVYAVNSADGAEKWRFATGGAVGSSPAIGADGTIYIGSDDGNLYALTPNGKKKWAFLTGGRVQASPAIAPSGTIYVGSYDGYFYAINPDGTQIWRTTLGGKSTISSAAVRADGVIIVGSDDYRVRAVNPVDGTFAWTAQTGDYIESSPVISPDGSIYVGSLDGKLYAFPGNGSPLSGYSAWPMRGHDASHSGSRGASSTGGQLVNLSTRASAGGAANLIVGLYVDGSLPKNFLVRGIGPSLAPAVLNPMSDPRLELYSGQVRIGQNDDWGSGGNTESLRAAMLAVGAFDLPTGSKDAAILLPLDPGSYTAQIKSSDGSAGPALVEAYDAASTTSAARLLNLSTRARVASGEPVIAGLVIGGGGRLRVLLRAVGPGLAAFGVPNVLAQPTISLFSGQTLVRSNTGWTSEGLKADLAAAMAAVGAFPLASNAECAMLTTLTGGLNYTIQVAGVGGTSGEVIVEVYVVP